MSERHIGGWTRAELIASVGLLAGYVAVLAYGRATLDQGDPDWQRWALAVTTIALALGSVGVMIRRGRRSEELERFVLSESTSLAFFATMLAALTYGLLEAFVDAPRLTAWATWMFGMGLWAALSAVLQRSMR